MSVGGVLALQSRAALPAVRPEEAWRHAGTSRVSEGRAPVAIMVSMETWDLETVQPIAKHHVVHLDAL